MFQKIGSGSLSHFEENSDLLIYHTMNGYMGSLLKVNTFDQELINDTQLIQLFNYLFEQLSPEFQLTIRRDSYSQKSFYEPVSRAKAINDLSYKNTQIYLMIETKINNNFLFKVNTQNEKFYDFIKLVLSLEIEYGENGELKTKAFHQINKSECERLFPNLEEPYINKKDHIVFDQKLYGVVRVKQNSDTQLSIDSLNHVFKNYGSNLQAIAKLQKASKLESEYTLSSLLTEAKQANTLGDHKRGEESHLLNDLIQNNNMSLMHIELLFIVESSDEKTLRESLKKVSELVQKQFGTGTQYIESECALKSFFSQFPGTRIDISFSDVSLNSICYLPLFASENHIFKNKEEDSMWIHRNDDHIQGMHLTSNLHLSGNTMIIGPKGSGKSVLCGLLTQSLFNKQTNKILKIDVGSSYVRECERYNGTRYIIDLNTPSGLNPLEVISKTEFNLEIADIISDFIEVLISKNVGVRFGLTDDERAELDKIVLRYCESRPKNASIQDFIDYAKLEIPNRTLLERWGKGGLFQNIFMPVNRDTDLRYRYYDFLSVYNSTNSDLVRGSTGAVMAQYNSEVTLSGRTGPRIFLFCDETTEFLNQCAPFFISTAKNSRKYGHATILINQESASFQVRDRKGDLTNALFENTDHHFLFSYPNDPEDIEKFKTRHKLSDYQYDLIKKLKYIKGQYSETLYKSKLGAMSLKVKLSPEEYWLLTSDKNDYDKLHKLVEIGFSQREAMQCLMQLHSQLYS